LYGLSHFPKETVNGFGTIVYLPLEKLKRKVRLRLKGTEFTGFHQYLTWEKTTLAQNSNFMQMKVITFIYLHKRLLILESVLLLLKLASLSLCLPYLYLFVSIANYSP